MSTATSPTPASPGNRLKLHPTPSSASHAARASIIHSSAKGWSPLQINKRDSVSSPLRQNALAPPSPTPSGDGPRRTSSSFKHVTKNSLVSKSPFKSTSTVQGQQAAGIYDDSASDKVIHERRAATPRSLGASPEKAAGAPATPKSAIGLGGDRPRSTSRSRTPSGRLSINLRKVSSEKLGLAFSSSSGRRSSGSTPEPKTAKDRVVSETKENDSPDVRAAKRTPRQSVGLKGLAKNEYVSKSPFLHTAKRIFSGEKKDSAKSSPKGQAPVEKNDVFGSPSPHDTSSPLRRASGEARGSSENMVRRAASNENLARKVSSTTSPRVSPSKASPATSRMVSGDSRSSSPAAQAVSDFSPVNASPSPARAARRVPSLTVMTGAGPSPLGRPVSDADEGSPSPSPAPIRSAMTPSRRLFGPRDWSGLSQDSPSKSKAVTFSSVAHVREFEPLSNENSIDGSFDSPPAAHAGWMVGHENLDELLSEGVGDDSFGSIGSIGSLSVGSIGSVDSLSRLRVTNPDTPSSDERPHESTTADFVNTLIEEGLFSPPTAQTQAMADLPTFQLPDEDVSPVTPTVSGSQVTPLWASAPLPDDKHDRDSAGIPYGRTHHAERAAAAHAHAPAYGHISQPEIPHQSDSQLLLNGNAAKPSLPAYSTPFDSQPVHAHQSGPMPDPFITIQTATSVLSPAQKTRDEGGVPLGRTSHADRVQAARMLATQSLGLGYPRHNPSPVPSTSSAAEHEQNRAPPVPPVDEDALFDVSLDNSREVGALPTTNTSAPLPEQLDLPSPVRHTASYDEQEDREMLDKDEQSEEEPAEVSSMFVLSIRHSYQKSTAQSKIFALPFISKISPFFSQQATVPAPAHPADESFSGSEDFDSAPEAPDTEEEEPTKPSPPASVEPPLTPPPAIGQKRKSVDSPHRIPSFDFEEISLHTIEQPTFQTARVISPHKLSSALREKSTSTPASTNTLESKAVSAPAISVRKPSDPAPALPVGDFGIVQTQSSELSAATQDSTTTRVRQRISREMIRETINQRIADGSISRRGSAQVFATTSSELSPSRPRRPLSIAVPPSSASKDKSLSIVPDSPSKRPALSPRSQTQSAHDVLKASAKDGVIDEPRSALDKIMDLSAPSTPVGNGPKTLLVSDRAKIPEIRARSPTPTKNASTPSKIEGTRSPSAASKSSNDSKKSRRSLSTSELGDTLEPSRQIRRARSNPRLSLGIDAEDISMLQAFNKEAENIGTERGYKIREKAGFQASYGQIGHGRSASEAEAKAWKSLRRPSDMNEHAAQIRAIRERQVSNGKTSGTIFVKVLGIEGLSIPIPDLTTYFCVTLDNGIDYIRTPYTVLSEGAKVNQEFSLVEHPNFEFSLSLDIRRDQHVLKMINDKGNPPPSIIAPAVKASTGLRGLFGSPRKGKKGEDRSSRAGTPQSMASTSSTGPDTLVKYFATPTSSTVAKTHVVFKPIAKNCDAKVLEIRYPMFAMFKGEADRSSSSTQTGQRKQVAKITLQIFRLPPLPGLKLEDLPTCIDDAVRGIRHHAWHECEYHEGVLTQEGGDCSVPRRRQFKLVGGNLVAINEVTKKHVTSIDLRKATQVIDLNSNDPYSEPAKNSSPVSRATTARRRGDAEFGTKPRSFRLEFGDDWIDFWADNQEEKDVWLATFKGLIGKIPSNPLWADLLATRYRDMAIKRSASREVKK